MAGWVVRTIFLWIALGAGLGLIGVNAIAPFFPRPGGSMNWYAAAQIYAPLVGAVWGLVAGVIGSVVGALFRSVQLYTWTMVTLAVAPYLPFLGDSEGPRGMPTFNVITAVLIAGLTGAAAWWVARRNGPPPRSSAT